MAAILFAFSHTSIMLSLVVLSDTFFVFLFLLALTLWLQGIQNGKWPYFIISGTLFGVAILVRSLAQLWPLLMFGIIYLLVHSKFRQGEIDRTGLRKTLLKGLTAVLIAIVVVSPWVLRNMRVHNLPIIAGAAANGAEKLVGVVIEDEIKEPPNKLWDKWREEYAQKKSIDDFNLSDNYRLCAWVAFKMLKERPGALLRVYVKLLWENLNDINYLHRILFPRNKTRLIGYEYDYKRHYLNYLNFALSVTGVLILLVRRNYYSLTVLVSIYLYFMLMLGFGRWQGSRLFFPGQIAATILMSVSIVVLLGFICNLIKKSIRRSGKIDSSMP